MEASSSSEGRRLRRLGRLSHQLRPGPGAPTIATVRMVGAGRGHLALFPVRGLPSTDAAAMLGNIASFEAERGTDGQPAHPVASDVLRNKAHLKQLWMYDLVHNPELLDAVESVIGPDILCWGASSRGQVCH
jgi:non-heme Fe2+,alpha-ketoglutarate-dependent halogenase